MVSYSYPVSQKTPNTVYTAECIEFPEFTEFTELLNSPITMAWAASLASEWGKGTPPTKFMGGSWGFDGLLGT
jgi:hypothetical protein